MASSTSKYTIVNQGHGIFEVKIRWWRALGIVGLCTKPLTEALVMIAEKHKIRSVMYVDIGIYLVITEQEEGEELGDENEQSRRTRAQN